MGSIRAGGVGGRVCKIKLGENHTDIVTCKVLLAYITERDMEKPQKLKGACG